MKKKIHILIIVVGIIFISASAFHSTIWFDESYSAAIVNHSINEIWTIGGNDVHPILYYWLLKIVNILFGCNIIAYRLFSVLGVAILGILGYTHIRKDFGEKVGMIFSYLSFFLPVMCVYAVEVRMYSWAATFVVITAIYAYRLLSKNTVKNWIIFGIFSLASCYTHYYGLMAAGLINLGLFIYILRMKKKEKSYIKNFVISAVIQVILYIPWLIYFVGQLAHVGGGFWIKLRFPDTLMEVFNFQYKGILDTVFSVNLENTITFIFAIVLYIYIGRIVYKQIKQKQDIRPAIFSIAIYIGVIIATLIISIFMPILYSRYLFVITGLLIFTLAFFLAKEERKSIIIVILSLMTIMALYNNIKLIYQNYDSSNMTEIDYIKENIQEGDIIVYSNIGNGSIIATFFTENDQYFLNFAHWDVEEAYKAYGPQMKTVTDYSFLDNYKGRIWLIDSEYMGLYEEFPKESIIVLKEAKRFDTKYHDYIYNVMLLEKN